MPNTEKFTLPQEFMIVGAAAQVGIFDAVKDKNVYLEELSDKTGTDLRALWTVVEALAALDYVKNDNGKVSLTEEAYSILYDKESSDYIGFSFMHTYDLLSSWIKLPQVLESGEPVPRMEKSPESKKNFISAMSYYARKSAYEVAEYISKELPQNLSILDVGGGPLTYAEEFAQQGAVVTVLDLPEVIDMMKPELDPQLSIEMIKGDFTEGLPEGPFNLVYLGNVSHIYGENENRKLFSDAWDVLKNDGFLVINDMIRGTGPGPALFAVNMLINTYSGGTWTYEQYKTWLEDAGFRVSDYQTVADCQLIIAKK